MLFGNIFDSLYEVDDFYNTLSDEDKKQTSRKDIIKSLLYADTSIPATGEVNVSTSDAYIEQPLLDIPEEGIEGGTNVVDYPYEGDLLELPKTSIIKPPTKSEAFYKVFSPVTRLEKKVEDAITAITGLPETTSKFVQKELAGEGKIGEAVDFIGDKYEAAKDWLYGKTNKVLVTAGTSLQLGTDEVVKDVVGTPIRFINAIKNTLSPSKDGQTYLQNFWDGLAQETPVGKVLNDVALDTEVFEKEQGMEEGFGKSFVQSASHMLPFIAELYATGGGFAQIEMIKGIRDHKEGDDPWRSLFNVGLRGVKAKIMDNAFSTIHGIPLTKPAKLAATGSTAGFLDLSGRAFDHIYNNGKWDGDINTLDINYGELLGGALGMSVYGLKSDSIPKELKTGIKDALVEVKNEVVKMKKVVPKIKNTINRGLELNRELGEGGHVGEKVEQSTINRMSDNADYDTKWKYTPEEQLQKAYEEFPRLKDTYNEVMKIAQEVTNNLNKNTLDNKHTVNDALKLMGAENFTFMSEKSFKETYGKDVKALVKEQFGERNQIFPENVTTKDFWHEVGGHTAKLTLPQEAIKLTKKYFPDKKPVELESTLIEMAYDVSKGIDVDIPKELKPMVDQLEGFITGNLNDISRHHFGLREKKFDFEEINKIKDNIKYLKNKEYIYDNTLTKEQNQKVIDNDIDVLDSFRKDYIKEVEILKKAGLIEEQVLYSKDETKTSSSLKEFVTKNIKKTKGKFFKSDEKLLEDLGQERVYGGMGEFQINNMNEVINYNFEKLSKGQLDVITFVNQVRNHSHPLEYAESIFEVLHSKTESNTLSTPDKGLMREMGNMLPEIESKFGKGLKSIDKYQSRMSDIQMETGIGSADSIIRKVNKDIKKHFEGKPDEVTGLQKWDNVKKKLEVEANKIEDTIQKMDFDQRRFKLEERRNNDELSKGEYENKRDLIDKLEQQQHRILDERIKKFGKKAANNLPKVFGDRVNKYVGHSLLWHPATILNNIVNNASLSIKDSFSAKLGIPADIIMGGQTGERFLGMKGADLRDNYNNIKQSLEVFKNSWKYIEDGKVHPFKEMFDHMGKSGRARLKKILGVDFKELYDVDKYHLETEIGSKTKMDKALSKALAAPDAFFLELNTLQQLEVSKKIAEREIKSGKRKEVDAGNKEGFTLRWKDLKESEVVNAFVTGKERTFQDKNIFSDLLVQIKKGGKAIGDKLPSPLSKINFADILLASKFAKTAGNIVSRKFQYTPANLMVALGRTAKFTKDANKHKKILKVHGTMKELQKAAKAEVKRTGNLEGKLAKDYKKANKFQLQKDNLLQGKLGRQVGRGIYGTAMTTALTMLGFAGYTRISGSGKYTGRDSELQEGKNIPIDAVNILGQWLGGGMSESSSHTVRLANRLLKESNDLATLDDNDDKEFKLNLSNAGKLFASMLSAESGNLWDDMVEPSTKNLQQASTGNRLAAYTGKNLTGIGIYRFGTDVANKITGLIKDKDISPIDLLPIGGNTIGSKRLTYRKGHPAETSFRQIANKSPVGALLLDSKFNHRGDDIPDKPLLYSNQYLRSVVDGKEEKTIDKIINKLGAINNKLGIVAEDLIADNPEKDLEYEGRISDTDIYPKIFRNRDFQFSKKGVTASIPYEGLKIVQKIYWNRYQDILSDTGVMERITPLNILAYKSKKKRLESSMQYIIESKYRASEDDEEFLLLLEDLL